MVTSSQGHRHTLGRVAIGLVSLVTLLTGIVACTPDQEDPPNRPAPEVALTLALVHGVDGLEPEARDALQSAVGDLLGSYVRAAFLGDYPRNDFVSALDAFTSAVADSAAEDLDLLTGSGFTQTTAVSARKLIARIAAYAPEDEALGATAHISFEFEVEGPSGSRTATLNGRLMLAPDQGEWRIFGYNVTLDDGGTP